MCIKFFKNNIRKTSVVKKDFKHSGRRFGPDVWHEPYLTNFYKVISYLLFYWVQGWRSSSSVGRKVGGHYRMERKSIRTIFISDVTWTRVTYVNKEIPSCNTIFLYTESQVRGYLFKELDLSCTPILFIKCPKHSPKLLITGGS